MRWLSGWFRYRRYLRALVVETYRPGRDVEPGTLGELKAKARRAATATGKQGRQD